MTKGSLKYAKRTVAAGAPSLARFHHGRLSPEAEIEGEHETYPLYWISRAGQSTEYEKLQAQRIIEQVGKSHLKSQRKQLVSGLDYAEGLLVGFSHISLTVN